jgi:hypothetical protein
MKVSRENVWGIEALAGKVLPIGFRQNPRVHLPFPEHG